MADKEIRNNKGDLIGTISDSSSGSSDLENWQKWGLGIAVLFGVIGGFVEGGIGGAIVGAIIGPLAAIWICVMLAEIVPWLLLAGFIYLIIYLWGVGK